jgi:CheY-like chemotaxis protein
MKPPHPIRLLLIDGNAARVKGISAYLTERQDFSVETAKDGRSAFKILEKQLPDMILLASLLPDMISVKFCRQLRSYPSTAKLPVVYLFNQSDLRSSLMRSQILEAGADGYVYMPTDADYSGGDYRLVELPLTIKQLLLRSSQKNVLDPVTGLISNTVLMDELKQTPLQKDWAYLDIALEGFDAFEEKYGFLAADDALRYAAMYIKDTLSSLGLYHGFFSHYESNRFAVITPESKAADIVYKLKEQIPNQLAWYFTWHAEEYGTPKSKKENDSEVLPTPLQLGLSIGVAYSSEKEFASIDEITQLAVARCGQDQNIFEFGDLRLIEERVRKLLGIPNWALLSIFIRYYEEYREIYERDAALSVSVFTHKLIDEVAQEFGGSVHFVERTADNHFWMIASSDNTSTIYEILKSRFAVGIKEHYLFFHQQQGFIRLENGEDVPFMDLAVGIHKPTNETDPKAMLELAEVARRLDV